jgi:hypothetical protein
VKPKAFAALAAVTAVMLVIAIASHVAQNRFAVAKVSGDPLFPGLAAQAGGIAKITIQEGDKKLALARSKDGWVLENRDGYPAKAQAVRALLLKLSQAELVEAKTRNAERYAMLELEDPLGKDAKSRLLRLLNAQDGLIAEAVLGKKRSDAFGSAKGGTYVRKPGVAQTWLANNDIDASIQLRDWVEPHVLDIPAAKISRATIEISGEEPLQIGRDAADASKHTLLGMPDGKKLKDTYTVGAIVRAAGSIELEDVRRQEPPHGEMSTVRLEADGGLLVTLRLRKEGEDYWLSLEATGADGEGKKSAEDIMRRAQGWEFKLSSTKAESILKRRTDLLVAS